ncbi:MAG: DUF1579 domain-containing protein [Phycisphaerales bacterium]
MSTMTEPKPTEQHLWLQQFIGEWTYAGACEMEPGQVWKFEGTESVRAIGPFWILAEGKGTCPEGKPATMILTVGYNPKNSEFVGSWIGSMMDHLWNYRGWLNDSKTTLTLEAEGACPMASDNKIRKFQDITEFKSKDHRVFMSRMQQDDGSWKELMRAEYRRKR